MSDAANLEQFRTDAKAFLDANASLRPEESFVWGEGSDRVGVLDEKTPEQEAAELRAAKEWKAKEFDAGFGWLTGPEHLGGRALTAEHTRAYTAVRSDYSVPNQTAFGIGLGMVAPTILAHAIPEVAERYLRDLYRGDIVACQLFSEPIAGSDLAGIQTRAIRDGDEWILTGQKVWTSGAQYSDIGEIITRTSPDKPKHKGLTMFLVDMHAPGVEVRPLRQMTGGASFNEVFFEEVRVPDSHRLGDVDEGWTVALTTLMNERAAIGGGGAGVGTMSLNRFVEMARHYGVADDPLVRQRLADAYVRINVARYTNLRGMATIRAGQLPGPEMSIGKLALTRTMQEVGQMLGEILGPRMIADSGEWGTFAWSEFLCGVPGMRVAGGTDEIMKNVIGERVLGLPKEPKIRT
ncbi:MAG TPA: acyl-CoA dehydrogenase family protein [Acidimicrobiia bacterium]|nr:acyl-CoA dehydrogenase family protein [Acidimicrobiia bacterium]